MRRTRAECDCGAITRPDAGTIDRLARLQLAARRAGRDLCLTGAQPCLIELIDFCGLAEVLGLEMAGEAEQREKLCRVEEEGDLSDAAV